MSQPDRDLRSFLSELKRRKVFQVAGVYAVVAFVLWQATEIAFPTLRLPESALTLIIAFTLLGFPIALVLAWAFEVTPEANMILSRSISTCLILEEQTALLEELERGDCGSSTRSWLDDRASSGSALPKESLLLQPHLDHEVRDHAGPVAHELQGARQVGRPETAFRDRHHLVGLSVLENDPQAPVLQADLDRVATSLAHVAAHIVGQDPRRHVGRDDSNRHVLFAQPMLLTAHLAVGRWREVVIQCRTGGTCRSAR